MMKHPLLTTAAAFLLVGCSAQSSVSAGSDSTTVQAPTPQVSSTSQAPATPQQQYVSDMNAQYSDYTSGIPDPGFNGNTNNQTGTDAAILDNGAQLCEALATGGDKAAANLIQQGYSNGSGSDAEKTGIIALTKSDLCPTPGSYQSKYQQYTDALKATGLYGIVVSADSLGDPVQIGSNDICLSAGTPQGWISNFPGITQPQANKLAKLTEQYLCPGTSLAATVPTITYEATGSNILYGPTGSQNSGYSGMNMTDYIPASLPAYYAISVMYGSCKLTITFSDGTTTTSQGSAPGGMANCELVNMGGSWYDANSG